MLTKFNSKQLAQAYGISSSTYHSYLNEHRKILESMATTRVHNGNVIKSQNYNTEQLEYIVNKIFKDTPEGYEFNGKTLIKITE